MTPIIKSRRPLFVSIVAGALLVAIALQGKFSAAAELPVVRPERVGFSAERLQRLDAALQEAVDHKEFAGLVTILARHGKVIEFRTYGKRDLAGGLPMTKDTIFRLYSMSKPVTAAAMMILYENGRWNPQDPIAKFIPEFKGLKVFKPEANNLNGFKSVDSYGKLNVEDPDHPPTLGELMTHTAGFGYGWTTRNAADLLYIDQKGQGVLQGDSLQELIDRLSRIPLLYQPGTQWAYSASADIQGYLIEKLTGMSLPEFMKSRIFAPLHMPDTGFYVPVEKRGRFVTAYRKSEKEELVEAKPQPGFSYDAQPGLPSGGAGLVSTAMDFYRFAQMLANGGQLDGVRILAPKVVHLMMSNHLPASLMTEYHGGGYFTSQPKPGLGHGYGGAVVTDPGEANVPLGKGSYFWTGADGTWFWVDPSDDIVFIGMVQRAGFADNYGMPPNLEEMSHALVYQALVNPER